MNIAVKKKKNSFYLLIGIVGFLAVVVGFFTTYIRPSYNGKFIAPVIVHIHSAFAFSWILLFLVQTIAVKVRNFRLHITLGYFGLFIALGIVATMLPTGLFQVNRDLSKGMGKTAVSQIVGIVTTALMFAILVAAGFAYRKKPKIHKRLLLLATIVLLWPAWFRFRHYFPSVPRPDIWFGVVLADSLILLSWIADKLTYGKIHPVLFYGGLLIIAEHAFEVLTFDSDPWRLVANTIYDALV
jgi:vacuolar-type H+-ATPase subunit I/STV1